MMKTYVQMNETERVQALVDARAQYETLQAKSLKLDITRGKPCTEQLQLSNAMLAPLTEADYFLDGVDTRNYGNVGGLPSSKKLFAEIMDVAPNQVFVGGNASLQLMYDTIAKAFTNGLVDSPRPWSAEPKVKFLCPCPGYDRHFHLSLSFGIELIPIALSPDGPDMDAVEQAVADPAVKGIWCVPKYSNPDGYVYSAAVCARMAKLKPAAPDFVIMWDNAYVVHDVFDEVCEIPNLLALCADAGRPNMCISYASTSKITWAGAGVSAFAAGTEQLQHLTKLTGWQTIGYNKVNEMLHVRFLKDLPTTKVLMKQHAAIMRPKFEAVLDALDAEIAPLDIATWSKPNGGYFVSLYAMHGTAKRVHQLCKEAGVTLTPAGASYPYGNDPADSNLRIAPTFATFEEVALAMQVLTLCLKIAALEKLSA